MGKVRCMKLSSADYAALDPKDGEVLYFVNETGTFGPDSLETNGRVYLGDKLLSAQAAMSLHSGLKVMYNGSDVTESSSLGSIIANATSNWYGSQGAYNQLVDNSQIQTGVAYHINVQPDWNETDPKHLGYIKNKPQLLKMNVSDHTAVFNYN